MSYFALIPAAGGGLRMGSHRPKQYLSLAGKPLIRHAIDALSAVAEIARIFVVLAPDDDLWSTFDWHAATPRIEVLGCGGATRAASVTNGLRALGDRLRPDDWILVHDAARACLTPAQVRQLIHEVGDDPVGGLLAIPVADTLKRAHPGDRRVAATVSRADLWQAQTPQMFRYALLLEALESAPAVTDEAGAIEAQGLHPRLVAADATNFKITYPLDLQLAEWVLAHRET